MNELTTITQTGNALAVSPTADKDTRHRLTRFNGWLSVTGGAWYTPDMATYRDHLLDAGLSPSSVSSHLSTVRGQYRRAILDRVSFFAMAAHQADDFVEQKAIADEIIARLENAIDPEAAPCEVTTHQDHTDTDHLRLTRGQAESLMASPGTATLGGLRDTAVIALMLCTGIREAELSALTIGDLRQRLDGELALHVRKGKGRKARLVPYGELSWVLAIVDRWLSAAGIDDGPVFRGLYRSGKLRPGNLSVRAIQYILAAYPVMIDGVVRTARPHDLRRTYAKRFVMAGGTMESLRQNLGHANIKTTQGYVGAMDGEARRAPAMYRFDLTALESDQMELFA